MEKVIRNKNWNHKQGVQHTEHRKEGLQPKGEAQGIASPSLPIQPEISFPLMPPVPLLPPTPVKPPYPPAPFRPAMRSSPSIGTKLAPPPKN
ncbi:MAG: hypothetical protein R6U85_09645 [Salinivirgaceae bacterium]